MLLKDSKTKDNLMRAFAGESQARNRYTFAASEAKKQKLHVIESVFKFTANQERAHAKTFYELLTEMADQNILIDGNYPIDISDDLVKLLRSAQHNEFQEYEHDYANFSKIAEQEGFAKVSQIFSMIADVEKTHGERFKNFADMLEQGKLFKSDTETQWICLNCGRIHTGKEAPEICPICRHTTGYFMRLEQSPYRTL